MIYFKDFTPPSRVERLVPTVTLFLVIELDGMTRQVLDNETGSVLQEVRGGWISGFQKRFLTISAHPGSEMLAVQFKPLGACRFLPLPLSDFEDRIVLAEEVFPESFDGLRTRLQCTGSAPEKFQIMENWLESMNSVEFSTLKDLEKVVSNIQRDHCSSISSLVLDYPGSHRRLIADFKKFLGTTPKFFQRVLRFESILASIEQKTIIDWSELSYQWGFSDQAHLIREFVFFSGFNPTNFTNREFQYDGTNFFPLVKNIQDMGADHD
jgi:hypothetical protein